MVTTNINLRVPQIDSGASALDSRLRTFGANFISKASSARDSTPIQASYRLLFAFLSLYILRYINYLEASISTQMPPFRWINHIFIIILTFIILAISAIFLFEIFCFLSGIPFKISENSEKILKKIEISGKIFSPKFEKTEKIENIEEKSENLAPILAPILNEIEESSSELDEKFTNSPLDPIKRNNF